MLNLRNMGPIAFRKYIKGRNVYIFGAGKALDSALEIYFADTDIKGIADNNEKKWGTRIWHNNKGVEISNPRIFSSIVNKEKSLIFITSPFYAAEIVEQLDEIEEIDGMECFLQVLIRNTKEKSRDFEFTKGPQKIPKKIHYIWVGGKPLPDEYKANIETWKKYNPDYEIIQWNETNYDFTKCDYVREAYESKSWGFASNYARLDIIYNEGGIYLDTDVKVLKPLDCVLNDSAFFNMGCADRVNLGCGFGAVQNNGIVGDIRKAMDTTHFLSHNGMPGKKQFHTFVNPIIKGYGFELKNEYQKIHSTVLYPNEVMSPFTLFNAGDFLSKKTLSVHYEDGTWKTDKEKEGLKRLKQVFESRIRGTLL